MWGSDKTCEQAGHYNNFGISCFPQAGGSCLGQQREELRRNENYQKIIAMAEVSEISLY